MIVYEYPLNESIRTWLRLERLFMRFSALLFRDHAIDHHYAIQTLFEIADLCANANPKVDIMNELLRQQGVLEARLAAHIQAGHSNTDTARRLEEVLQLLQASLTSLQASGKPGQNLLEDNLLKNIKGRAAIAGGSFEFDRPLYHAWLHLDGAQRQHELAQWFSGLQPLAEGVQQLLSLVRSTAEAPQRVLANQGYYEQSLPPARAYQLLRIHMPDDPSLAADIKGARQAITVTIQQRNPDGQIQRCMQNIYFDMVLCF